MATEVAADKGTTTWTASDNSEWGQGITGTTVATGGLQAPRCTRVEDASASAEGDSEAKDPGKRVTITVSSPSNAQRIGVGPMKGTVRDIVVDGTKAPGLEESGGDSGMPADSTRLSLSGIEAGQTATVSFAPLRRGRGAALQ